MRRYINRDSIRLILVMMGVISLAISTNSFAINGDAEFAEFKKQQEKGVNNLKSEFDDYKKALNEGFDAYKKTYQSAYKANESKIIKIWGEYRPGDKSRWVEYEKGGIRKSINFESGEVEIEILAEKTASRINIEKALKRRILALMLMSKREAFKNDPVAQAVEKKMKGNPLVKTSKVSSTPLISSLVPEVASKDLNQIKKISTNFERKAVIDERPAKLKSKKIVRLKFTIPPNSPKKSKAFLKRAQEISNKEKLPFALVMGVMEAESAFNPMAKSHVPAYGLMQIVPRSAGQDATAYLFGKSKILSPSYLYNSDKNIEIGGAYLHILYFRYLKKIKDPVSRLYCAIASYNTGAGNVAKAFTGKMNINKAASKINKLTPQEVYRKLRADLPHKETRDYIVRVSTNMKKYQ